MTNKRFFLLFSLLFLLFISLVTIIILYSRTSKNEKINIIKNTYTENSIKKKPIDVKSNLKEFTLIIPSSKKESFNNFLEKLGFFENDGIFNIRTSKRISAQKLKIILRENLEKPVYEIKDENENLWDAVQIDYFDNGEVVINVFRKDWGEKYVNLLINDAIVRIASKTHKPFDIPLDDNGKIMVNQNFFVVQKI